MPQPSDIANMAGWFSGVVTSAFNDFAKKVSAIPGFSAKPHLVPGDVNATAAVVVQAPHGERLTIELRIKWDGATYVAILYRLGGVFPTPPQPFPAGLYSLTREYVVGQLNDAIEILRSRAERADQ
jgi:hypothetical protein